MKKNVIIFCIMKKPKRIRNHVNPLSITEKVDIDKFENNNSVIIDIGSYRGEFGEKLLEKFGEKRNFIFFEIRKPYQEYLEKKFSNFKNVKVLGGDAGRNLANILKKIKSENIFVDKIFINFPDPWFKKKHHKRRLVNKTFLIKIFNEINFETEIIFQTDQKELFQDTIKEIKKTKKYKIKKFSKPLWGIQSYWEEIKINEGDKIFRMILKKKKTKKFFIF